MNFRVLIVDDEELARRRLTQLLDRETDMKVIGECSDGLQAVEAIERDQPDLVLLDVRMPALDGFGVVETVGPAHMPTTIFVTAYDESACQVFESRAVDYILKPFDPDRFKQSLDRARTWIRIRQEQHENGQAALMASLPQGKATYPDRLIVKHGERHFLVRAASIQWVEAQDNYVRLHVEGTSYMVRQTMSGILARLDPRRFRRIHRSAIVNLDYINEMQPWNSGDYLVLMRDGTRLTLSRTYRDQLQLEW